MSDFNETVLFPLTDQEFNQISTLIYNQFGINLTDKKKALVRGRLNKVLHNHNCSSFSQYLNMVKTDTTGVILAELVDRISTNHTYFYREPEHFSFLIEQAFPDAMKLPQVEEDQEIRLWCAGCATGEEAYTLAICATLFREKNPACPPIKILATDISITALKSADAGVFVSERVVNVPENIKRRFFRKKEESWEVSKELRSMILYKRLNFMEAFPLKRPFPLIFCRNVMIYFDKTTKDDLVKKFVNQLIPGGYFFIGHSETLGRESFDLKYVKPSLYRKNV